MGLLKELKGSFVGGQVSPSLQNRIDLQKFSTFLKTAKNTKIQPEGGISNRAGTIFVATAKTAYYRLTFNINVSATVTINEESKTGTEIYFDLPIDDTYTYTIGASGYEVQTGDITLDGNKTLNITLEPTIVTYNLKIIGVLGGETIKINNIVRDEYTGNSGETVTWEVSKEGYNTKSGTLILSEDTTLTINLNARTFLLEIRVTPSDATITINGIERNYAELEEGSSYTYSITKDGYIPISDSGTIEDNITIEKNMMLYITEQLDVFTFGFSPRIQNFYENTISLDGTYKVTLLGGVGWQSTNNGYSQLKNGGYGGKIECNLDLHKNDTFSIKYWLGPEYTQQYGDSWFGGHAIGFWLNEECILVAGGGAGKGFSNLVPAGNGYIGGTTTSPVNPNNPYQTGKGYSVTGNQDGTSTSESGASGGKKTLNGYTAYGGSGYVKAGLTATQYHAVNPDFMGFKIEYIG